MKKIFYPKVILLLLLVFSCQNENVEIDNSSNSKFKDLNPKFTQYQSLDSDDSELLDLKGKIQEKHNRMIRNPKLQNKANLIKVSLDSDNIDWSKSFKREEGKLKGVFVPFKNINENEVTMISSLLIDGRMRLFIVKGIKTNENNFSINFYSLSGVFVKKIGDKNSQYLKTNGINKSQLSFMLTDPSECTATSCIDDYDTWFNSSSCCQRFGNNTNQTITYKREGVGCVELAPGEYTEYEIDGFKIGNKVHKVTDGYNTFGVNGEDDYDEDYDTLDYVVYAVIGGDLSSSPDEGWDCLFD